MLKTDTAEKRAATEYKMATARNLGEEPSVLMTFTAGLDDSSGAPQGHCVPSGITLPHLGQIVTIPSKLRFFAVPRTGAGPLSKVHGWLLLYYRKAGKIAIKFAEGRRSFLIFQKRWTF